MKLCLPIAALVLLVPSAYSQTPTDSAQEAPKPPAESLASSAASEIPLNKRDFSALLLLSVGTSTDSNGTNYTPQFAINGQRGVEATFAMDGAETSDPEMGGSTFSNFNVDAIQAIDSTSGWMPAEIGHGSSGFTNISTRSGNARIHGSFFEFIRNSSLDARNYFDHSSPANPGRIPPFRRNEFGLTNGGPVILPHIYDGEGKTFYFVELQALRQVLGTTQVFPVPTAQERSGIDSTAFPGDPLTVRIDPGIAKILARYPLPNYPQGAFGVHTYATSAKILTTSDQFSVRLDHQAGPKNHFFGRVSFDNLIGPTTNPDQTALDPSFGVQYRDHQRNVTFDYARTASPRLILETQFDITRTTPAFITNNHTDPAIKFNDGLYESFNSTAGSVIAAFNNLFSLRQSASFTTKRHNVKAGAEVRLNRDTSYFGQSLNGEFDFGGGAAYSPVEIRSQSGAHVIHAGDPLPDTLSSFLVGSAFNYNVAVASPFTSGGEHIGPAATSRSAWGAWIQDTWKINDRFTLNYGLRYEHYTPIEERAHRTSSLRDANNALGQIFVVNPQPAYDNSRFNWSPRVQLDTQLPQHLILHAGGALTTVPPNIWQDNLLTGGSPFAIYPRLTSSSANPIPYGYQIDASKLPRAYTPDGADIFPNNNTKAVAPNTLFDVDRYERDLAAISPGDQINPISVSGVDPKFGNAYLGTWTAGLERSFGSLNASATYIGTAAMRLPRISFPNAYPGATPAFARHTEFDAQGNVTGGFGTEQLIRATSHSSYHALQASLQGTTGHGGPGLQASYTWSKSLDDTSTVSGGLNAGASGAVTLTSPQDPFDTHPEKGPSSFDTTHVFSLSAAQDLHLESIQTLEQLPMKLRSGWEVISISTITSGSPFTVYSGVQQTGAGAGSADRPDLITTPALSTARTKREDYFGLGDGNASFFSIPIGIPGGTGPNSGRFGTLGRNTFRGPAFYDFDVSLIKDTPVGHRGKGELAVIQFRSEFFNVFNIANLGLPANILTGSGFGVISKTAGTSRQVQFSLKILY
ncbi:TonB-dependent receptor domain-containing protein [Granulicella sibirica]|uniref:Oar protein n=1 Tax=Granulicella sibirica TaxID=2479048 RepID=A0A4Q0SV42_9BACT|nr:TonB-dependent receptor [Granulicella sibirica]RXH54627.1 Oar protein [Granulicella sibirica]